MPYCIDDNLVEGSNQSIGRYGVLSKHELGLGFLDAQVVSLLSAEPSKDIEQAPHVEGSMTI